MNLSLVFSTHLRLMAVLLLMASLGVNLHGASTIDFVQFTDPHLFEKQKDRVDEVDNLAAFSACINEANRLHRQMSNDIGKGFDFIIVTGDLGIEELDQPPARTNALTVVSELIRYSLITNWFFVPGNNDLLAENPTNITTYHRFIEGLRTKLAGSICVSNLCPPGTAYHTNSVSAEFQIGKGHFIGFDNACFKSDTQATNATNFHNVQLANIRDVANKVSAISDGFAYIFYHIPETDDPLAVTKPNGKFSTNLVATQKIIGNNKLTNSCWIVFQDVRDEWDKVVGKLAVKGLLAGHLHSDDRTKYEKLDWGQSTDYLSVSKGKLLICPPIACKRQTNWNSQARGFRTYSVDATSGNLLNSTIIWYEGFAKPDATMNNIIQHIVNNKDVLDLLVNSLTLFVTAIGFYLGLKQWRRGQEWQRAEKMDKFVQQFEADELLKLATTTIDWTRRTIIFREKEFTITNTDALMALRIHTEMKNPAFEGEQPTLRDAYDALLAFFSRLELALANRLIDAEPARQYFRYWLTHFLSFEEHAPVSQSVEEWIEVLKQNPPKGEKLEATELKQRAQMILDFMAKAKPAQLVDRYIAAYGDKESIDRLKGHLLEHHATTL